MRTQRQDHETLVTSYRYLRAAIVGLVLCLAVAVLYQTTRQGMILSSISAYYYTPAQTIFVGALIAVGVCMIALKGTREEEDVLLNISGMLAPLVAIVPTARSADYKTAVAACRESEGFVLADHALTAVDCLGVRALADATQASIDNNMVSLLCVGVAALLATLYFTHQDHTPGNSFRVGFAIVVAVYVLAMLTFILSRETFTENAHYIAAVGFFACIVAVAVINALRHQGVQLAGGDALNRALRLLGALFLPRDRYAMVALAMLLAIAVGGALILADAFEDTLFWLEASLILLFAAFWVVQTVEWWQHDRRRTESPKV